MRIEDVYHPALCDRPQPTEVGRTGRVRDAQHLHTADGAVTRALLRIGAQRRARERAAFNSI